MLYIVFNSLRKRINRYSYFGIYKDLSPQKNQVNLYFLLSTFTIY